MAIGALLANGSAQIREATLDALIARAADETAWHEPLVRRPHLARAAAEALSRIVADALLAELADRTDIDAATTADLRRRVSTRLARMPAPRTPSDPMAAAAVVEARARCACGRLTEAELLDVAARGDTRLAAAMLAVAADVPYASVARAAELRSAKGLVSLVWKAGYAMSAAVPLQILLGRLAPAALMTAGPGGTFPLSIEEMRWQAAFLGLTGR